MATAISISSLQAILSEQSAFTRELDFRVRTIGDGECELVVPFQEKFERPGGILSGQVLMTAADVAMWLAIKTRRGLDDPSVTLDMHTSFVRSGRREPVVCRARVLRLGSTISHGVADCTNEGGEVLSHHAITYARPARQPEKGAK
ncbi:MAG TPA: PaaI family thioesterase [Thermoanaerobaculia bacterium]|nr:PaaI family thioesterase [Thermoanaerobaculia bacterium]